MQAVINLKSTAIGRQGAIREALWGCTDHLVISGAWVLGLAACLGRDDAPKLDRLAAL
jgi:hypothetical protein